MSLAELLKKLRSEESLRDAAKRIGISTNYLAILESGVHPRTKKPPKITPETLKKIATAYKYDYMKLIKMMGYLEDAKYNPELNVPFPNNPTLRRWYEHLPTQNEESVEKLMAMWTLIQTNK